MCEFRIGQKVVCVDASTSLGRQWHNGDTVPVVGEIYTVTGIIDSIARERGPFSLIIREMPRGAWARSKGYFGYNSTRFRPLVEPEVDISIFQRMCVDATKRVSAE